MIAAIDPGLHGCGVALFDCNGTLDYAYYAKVGSRNGTASDAGAMAREVHNLLAIVGKDDLEHLLLEMPQVYVQRKGKDPNDLLGLAAVLGGICALFPGVPVTQYRPRDWKGTIDGDAMVERIKKRIPEVERSRIKFPSAKSLHHNCWDAVGIGLHYFGRLEKVRVVAR